MKKGIIISAFAGLGKTTLGNKYSNVIDLESTNYHWIFDIKERTTLNSEELKGIKQRQLNPEWPSNYIRAIQKYQNEYDIVLITASKQIRDILCEKGIDFTFAFPTPDSLDEIIELCARRNNNEQFIQGVKNAFYTWQSELPEYPYKTIFVNKSEYLEYILNRNKMLNNEIEH